MINPGDIIHILTHPPKPGEKSYEPPGAWEPNPVFTMSDWEARSLLKRALVSAGWDGVSVDFDITRLDVEKGNAFPGWSEACWCCHAVRFIVNGPNVQRWARGEVERQCAGQKAELN